MVALAVLGLEAGFETADLALIGEQDILGDRLVRPHGKARRAADFLSDVTSLAEGDLVVHIDHGIGRFNGLRTIEAAGAPHDCLEILYAGGDRVYLPVENIELLSRYGSDESEVALDKLGGVKLWEVRHEGVGLGMADGWARHKHDVGVCTATCGPGVTQLATAFVTAARAQSPPAHAGA